jgi:outer membrane protein TolC
VAAAEAQLDAAAQRVAQADAARRPTVALRASLGWSALTLGALGSTGAAASLLASVSQPLFDGGQRRAQLDAQQAAYDAARESYRARVLGALQDVEDALVALEAARRRLAALREAEQSASTAAWLAEQRYAAGVVDFLTVLETQRNRLSLQDGRASAEADAVTAHVRLVKALGGGVPAVAEAKPSDP